MYKGRHITVIVPALNEAPSISSVVDELFNLSVCDRCSLLLPRASAISSSDYWHSYKTCCQLSVCRPVSKPLVDQVIVCDNGSTDDTAALAESSGAIVTHEAERGYGAACLAALALPLKKDIVVFADGDRSVVPTELPALVDPLFGGADLVIGSRTRGNTERGALSLPQRFGNQLASFLIARLWSADVTDLGPFRATTQRTLDDLQVKDRRFGWTVEMQVRALQEGKTIVEVPVTTLRRIGRSKISGTVQGVIGAANGILGTIFRLYRAGGRKRAVTGALPGGG